MPGPVISSQSQEVSPFEGGLDKKRKSEEQETGSLKKVKQVAFNSQPEIETYYPPPKSSFKPTAQQPKAGPKMPPVPPQQTNTPEFWLRVGQREVDLDQEVTLGKVGDIGEALQLFLNPQIPDTFCSLSWLEDKIVIKATDADMAPLVAQQTGGKLVGQSTLLSRVNNWATIRLGNMRVQFRVPELPGKGCCMCSYVADKGTLQAETLQSLFTQYDGCLHLGRHPKENEIILGHRTISRRHAQLRLLEDGQVRVENLNSTNPLKVNEHFLTAKASETFPPGTHLTMLLGNVTFEMDLPGGEELEDTVEFTDSQGSIS